MSKRKSEMDLFEQIIKDGFQEEEEDNNNKKQPLKRVCTTENPPQVQTIPDLVETINSLIGRNDCQFNAMDVKVTKYIDEEV